MRAVTEMEYLARLPKTGISDRDAARLWVSVEAFTAWMATHRLSFRSPEAQAVYEQGEAAIDAGVLDAPREIEPAGYSKIFRADAKELCEFVKRFPRLPGRLEQVFELCVRDGLSLNECAAKLHIGRETVRAHLRRLRLLYRRFSL